MQQWLEEGPCESVINGAICGFAKGRRDLIVGSCFGGTANPPECASGAKLSLAPFNSLYPGQEKRTMREQEILNRKFLCNREFWTKPRGDTP